MPSWAKIWKEFEVCFGGDLERFSFCVAKDSVRLWAVEIKIMTRLQRSYAILTKHRQ